MSAMCTVAWSSASGGSTCLGACKWTSGSNAGTEYWGCPPGVSVGATVSLPSYLLPPIPFTLATQETGAASYSVTVGYCNTNDCNNVGASMCPSTSSATATLATGAIVGIVIGVLVAIIIIPIIVIVACCGGCAACMARNAQVSKPLTGSVQAYQLQQQQQQPMQQQQQQPMQQQQWMPQQV